MALARINILRDCCAIDELFWCLQRNHKIFRPSTLYLIIKVVATYAPVYLFIVSVVTIEGVPRSVGVLQPIILIGFLLNSRLSIRGMASFSKLEEYKKHRNVIIFGADEVGRQLAEAVKKSHYTKLIGFLDNNRDLQYQKINGVEVFAPETFED